MMERPTKLEYYLRIAEQVSKRSTCLRRHYGAVIVKNDEIISTGYNGGPRGGINCSQAGICYRQAHNIPHGEHYELCQSVHAEANAVISASRRDMIDSTLYLAGFDIDPITGNETRIYGPEPCLMCSRLIVNAGINEIAVFLTDETIRVLPVVSLLYPDVSKDFPNLKIGEAFRI